MVEAGGYSSLGDDELLALSVDDPRAFGAFYDRFEAPMLAFFYRATRRADIAADLTAEVFAVALGSAASYRPHLGSARAWLFGIARHELADAWQRGQVEDRARAALKLEALVLGDAELEQIERIGEGRGEALRLLDGLPAAQRDAITGRVLEERGYDELAASLRCSPSVVRQRVSRGLRSLRSLMERSG